MSKIPPLHVWTAVLVIVAFTAVSPVCAQTAAPQRGVQDLTTAPAGAPALKPAGPYYALVIGNNDYHHLARLQTAVNDAKDVADLLQESYGFHTNVLYDATRAQILDAIDSYRGLPENSNLLIYYAGHGHKDKHAHRAYWMPVDADEHRRPNWINSTDITDGLRAIPARHILVISDSCFSGDLTMRSAGSIITPYEHNVMLAKLLGMKSRHLMSSGSDEPVADSGTGGHSVFAGALLQSLTDMEEDSFTGEALLSQRVKPRVAGRSAQTPQYAIIRDTDNDLGDFVFFRSKKTPSAEEMLSSAKKYYDARQYDRALPLFRDAAEAANGEAASFLGYMYENGLGTLPKDDAQAVSWYRKAADSDNVLGMASLGVFYENGRGGLPKDNAQAVRWYRKAAGSGNALAMARLGVLYLVGRGGLPKDDGQAVNWFRKAADAGNGLGMRSLAFMYEKGMGGLPKDQTQAVYWYRKAADLGEESAKEALRRLQQ